MRDGNVLPQFTTNELVIVAVQSTGLGHYTCVAINQWALRCLSTPVSQSMSSTVLSLPRVCRHLLCDGDGPVFVPSSDLTLLPFTVSQHHFPLEFSVFISNGTCTAEDLYDSLYSLISETIDGETSTIDDFNVTEVDSENYDVSLSLVSQNITTPYLHLSTFAEIANSALPHARSLRKSVQLMTDLLNGDTVGLICPGTGSSVVEDSLVVVKLRYVCPPGKRLNSDYLLCCKPLSNPLTLGRSCDLNSILVSCERGHFSSEIERSRIVNGVSFSESVPVCERCALYTYADALGSITCSQCPNYHTTSLPGASSVMTVCAEETVPYFLEEDSKPTAAVPPLRWHSLRLSLLSGDSVEATSFSHDLSVSGSGGYVEFSGLSPALYTLRVVATNDRNDKAFIKTRFEITDDTERCTLHLINGGVSVSGNSATVEFTGRGPCPRLPLLPGQDGALPVLQSSGGEWVEFWETCPEGGTHWLWQEQNEPEN
ncbi:hypothetical protein GBAR_LOCUS19094 [Geodia barretti]|uniref:Tyrosine-protein kinase ephrin type A/B receptor-like domain-containing protein n=1 Tax=Geodia barretti TaxID=519541 RepID=A0AA35SPH8_GEOBA|nr:hypothetical protein GBAR_LOCUS19094 [Geodia barretti]